MATDRPSRTPPSLGHVRPDRLAGGPPPPPPPMRGPPTHARRPSGPHPRQPQPERRRSGGLKRALLYLGIGGGLIAALIAGLLVVTPPVETVRRHVIAEVERQTGRRLTIGSARLAIASGLGVTLTDLGLSDPPTMGGAALLTAERMELSLALLPLIVREVKVDRLTLVRPVLDLRVDAQGRRNWDFAGFGRPASPVRFAQAATGRATDAPALPAEARDFMRNASAPASAGDATGAGVGGLSGVSLPDVRIVQGRVQYADRPAGISHALDAIDATVSLPSLGGTLTVVGKARHLGEAVAVDLRVDPMRELLAQRPATVRLRLDGAPGLVTYDGRVTHGAALAADGRMSLKAASAEPLARLLGARIGGLERLGGVQIDGGVQVSGASIALSSAEIVVGRSRGTVTGTVDTGGPRPKINGTARLARLDLDELSGLSVGTEPAPGSAAGRFAAPPAAAPRSIDDLLKQEGGKSGGGAAATRVHGFRQRAGNSWEIEPIDASPLRSVDIDGRLQIAELAWAQLAGRRIQAAIELKDGLLRSSVTEAEVAGGQVRGLVSVDARQKDLTVGLNLSGDGVQLAPVLAALGSDLAEGRGRWVVTVSAKGASERDLVSTLAGRSEIRVTDGAVVGWDVDQIIAGLGRGQMPTSGRNTTQRTLFRELSGTFQIASGVGRSKDIKLDSATVHAIGTGTVNAVDRNVDFMFKPKVGSGGLEVPVRVAGPWDQPNVIPDVNAALASPQAQEAVRHLKDGNVEGALRSVLGNDPKADKKIDRAKDFLKGLIRPQQ